MSRYIDADALITDLNKGLWGKDWDKVLAEAIINEAPSIEPKRGEWIESGFEEIKCSVCGSAWDYCDNDCERFNFCPSCGCAMIKE